MAAAGANVLIRLASLAAGAALVLVGCSPFGGDASGPQAAIEGAAARTLEEERARATITMRIKGEGVPTRTVRGTGVFDHPSGNGRLSFGGAVTIVVDGIVYTESSRLGPSLPAGTKPWLRAELTDKDRTTPLDLAASVLTGTGRHDPLQSLTYLELTRDARRVGAGGTVAGVSTTLYRATVDLEQLDDERAREFVRRAGIAEVPVDVWIDERELVRKLLFEYRGLKIHARLNALDYELVLSDFGTRVRAQPPPPDQVTDVTNLNRNP